MVEHAVDVRREIVIDADADVVWDVVADAERQAEASGTWSGPSRSDLVQRWGSRRRSDLRECSL